MQENFHYQLQHFVLHVFQDFIALQLQPYLKFLVNKENSQQVVQAFVQIAQQEKHALHLKEVKLIVLLGIIH